MKKPSIVVMLVLLTACSSGQGGVAQPAGKQQEKVASTALEAFLGKRGQMIMKEFYDLGAISSLGRTELKAIVISEPNSAHKIKGLKVEVQESGRLERSNSSFIDLDELESLSQALAYMADAAQKWTADGRAPYTEIIFTSKGELQVGFYESGKDVSAFCRSGSIGAATAYFNVREMPKLKGFVDQAITLLKSK